MSIHKGDERKEKGDTIHHPINKIKKTNVMKTIFDLSSGEIVYLRFKNGEYRSGLIGILLVSPDQYSQFYQNKSKSILKWLFKMDIFHLFLTMIVIFHIFQLLLLLLNDLKLIHFKQLSKF